MKPSLPITDPRFIYVDAAKTDIRARFAKVRRELAKATGAENIRPINNEKRKA